MPLNSGSLFQPGKMHVHVAVSLPQFNAEGGNTCDTTGHQVGQPKEEDQCFRDVTLTMVRWRADVPPEMSYCGPREAEVG